VDVIIGLIAILVMAKALGEVAERLGYPSMIGEIVAGIILGPTVFGLIHFDDTISLFADLGIIALLFISGAEINLRSFSKAKRVSAITAVAGVILPFVLGSWWHSSSRLILNRCCLWA